MDEKIKRILGWSKGVISPPHTIELWPTFRCNLNCIFCDYKQKRDSHDSFINYSGELSTERWLEIIDDAGKNGVMGVRLAGGGEPLFYRDRFIAMAEKIKSLGMKGYLTTNCTLFDEPIIRRLVEMRWEKVEISIDGPDEETHDYLRGVKGSFEKIIDALKLFSRLKKESKSELPRICFSTVITNRNYNRIGDLVDLARKFNCDINLLSLTEATEESKNLKLNQNQRFELISFLASGNINGVRISADGFSAQQKEKHIENVLPGLNFDDSAFIKSACFEPWYYMQIISDGRVGPCCATYCNTDGESMGDKGVMEMWLGKHMTKLRNNLIEGKLERNCLNCPLELSGRADQIRSQLIRAYLESKNT